MWETIEKALKLVGLKKPNTIFVAADVRTEYLHFANLDYGEVEPVEKELNEMGVYYIGKYETLGIERDTLFDAR